MAQELHLVPVSFSWEPDADQAKTNVTVQEVLITGSWNEFKPTTLEKKGDKWSTELSMPPGKYKYSFTVDGQVKHVTNLPFTVDPATGTMYNIINVSMTSLGSQGLAPNRLKLLEGEEFSQFEPLTVRITNILRQYPDGSQILKELLQNADDARATHVKFVFDRRSFPSKKLFTDGMKLFQGPALYAYNSGVFEEKDFESIRRLGSSRKKNELGKTGRFGIGFNSIYHITDLPSFVSGKHLVMLDPHARYLPGETQSCGKRWDYLECPEVTTIFEDQVAPYKMLNCDMKSFFNGTIFRFPLRTDEVSPFSQISKLPYTEEKVDELFASFKKEGSAVLLFLKFVESVELYTWDKGDAEPKHYYSVVIKNAEKQNPITLNTVRTDRKVMYDSVSQGLSYLETMAGKERSYVIPLDVEVKDGTHVNNESWMLCNQIGGGKSSEMAMQEFKAAQGLRLVPWGGVATKSIYTKEHVKGRVFCFLPLPTETGLPVHVNGCFELSLNRRDVWHGEDLSGEGKKKVDWNNRLKQDVVGSAYAALIEQTALSIAKNNQLEYLIEFYEQWPNIKSTNSYWNDLSESVYSYLLKNQAKVLYSPSNGGCWVSASEAVFVYRNEDVHNTAVPPAVFKTVVQALIDENIPVVEVTPGLFQAFSHALGDAIKAVSPSLVRKILKTNWTTVPAVYQKNRSLVVHLLEYCLADRNFKDLQGINLVPMADKSFSKFESKDDTQIYLATDLEMSLFPNHLSMFVDSNIVSPTTNAELKSAELREVINVTIVGPKTVSQLFEHVLPKEWKNSYLVEWNQNVVSKEWLERFWQYLTFLTMNGNDKPETDFEQWPLVPCMGQRLCSLHPNTPCLLSHSSLSNDVITALAKLHCYVVDESEITLNNKILSNIFPAGDAAGVLNALTQCIKNANKSPTELFTVLSADEKIALKRFFSKYEWFENKVLNSAAQRDNLKQLPIFETFSKEHRFAAIDKAQYACPPENIPHDITSEYLLKRDSPHDKYLLEFLEISVLKRPEFYKSYLAEKLSSFTPEHRDQVMIYVLEDLNAIIKEDTTGDVVEFLSNLEFVPDSSGRLCPPRYLFDLEETDMNHMFTFEPVFPTGPYKDPAMLASLRKLGLKKQLGVKDFIDRIKSVPSYYKQDKNAALLRAKSLCAYLDRNFSMLETELSAEDFEVFTKELSATEWLPSISPAHFVSNYMSLNVVANDILFEFNQAFWFVGEPSLVAPNVTCLQRDALLCCGSRAILDYHPKNPYFIKTFNWVNPPKVDVVVSHTKKLASTSSAFNIEGNSGSKLSSFISTISDRVNEYLNNALSTGQITKIAFDELLDAECKWIWVAPYFAKKTQIVRELSTDLSPFIFSCPRDLKKYPNLYSTLDFKDYVEPEDLVGILKELLAIRANNKTPLTERELKLSLSAVTLLSESVESAKDIPNGLVLPSQSGYLMSPAKLVYDDMPWVKSLEAKTPENHQVIHPSIPNQIAKALGIRPCSLVVITNAVDPIKDQDGDASANKKLGKISEALHTRPQSRILTEMIQNADDAGANEFVVILDNTQHKDNSLFSPKMKEHQGPALYIYNNATFRPEDFENICTPGRSAKRGDISKIGRLGIGFSTLFHLSDLPSFVSGNYVVFCDAYTSHVPGSNSHHPYVRFNLNSNIVSLFPDQFATFNFMGCDVSKGYFPGTLFRVPLRQVLKGKESRLPGTIVSVDKVRKLIGRFMGQATSHLAFLNRIKKIETFQNEENNLKPWFIAEIENFTPELEKFRGKPKDIASYIDTQLSTLDDNDEEDLTVEDPNNTNNNNNTNEPEPGASGQKRPKKKKRAVKKIVAVNPIKRKLDVPLELQRETRVLNMKITKRAEGESTNERWLMSQYFDVSYVNKILTSKTKISGLRLPYSIVAARLPEDTKELDQREYAKKKKADDKEEKETSSGKLFYYVPLDIATGLPVQVHSNFDLTPEKAALVTTEELAEWNRVLRDTSVLGAYVHFIKGLQGCITRGEVKESQYYDFWPSTTSQIDQFWHPMVQSFYQVLAKQACLFSFMDDNTLIAPFESVFPNELILHKNTARLVDILKQIKFPLADAPEVIYQQFKFHSVNEIQQLSPVKLRNFLKKMAMETSKTYWTYDEFVINSKESALVLLNYCLESSKTEVVLPTVRDDADFQRHTSKNQKLKLAKAKKRQNWDTSQLDEEETLSIIQGLVGLPLCCLHNNAITVFGGQLKYMIDVDINTIIELIENLPAFKRTLMSIDVSKILRDFKISRKADLTPASVTNFGVTEFMENFHLVLPKEWRGREEINWDYNDISEAWLRKFWSVAKGKWSSLPVDWPIIPTEDFKLVNRGRAEYIFIPPLETEVVKGPKARLFDIMTKLQALFLNVDICPPTNETRKMCLSIKAEDVLLALRRVKPESCDNLTGPDRNFLLETLSTAVSIERIALEAKILKRLPLFETESETNPDFLVNLCADVICDNPKLFRNIPPELRDQLEEYGKTRFVAPQDEYFMMPPDVPSTSLNSKFLKFKPKLQLLYTCLGISAANRGHFLKKYVLPNYQGLSSQDQIRMLEFIKNNMVTLKNEIKHFDDLMSVFEFIPTRAGLVRRGVFLHDPTNAVFAFLFSDMPENFPDVRISSKEWINFLRDNFGLNTTLSEEHLLSAALKYSALPSLSVVQLRRLIELIQLFYQTHASKGFNDIKMLKNLSTEDSLKVYESLIDDVASSNRKKQRNKEVNRRTQRDAEAAFKSFIHSFINKAKNIQFVPCQWDPRLTNVTDDDPMDPSNVILQRIDDIALPEYRSIIWTVSPIFHPEIVPSDAVRAVWSLEPPNVTKVIQHISNLMVQGDRFKYKSVKLLQKDLKAAFKYIAERLEEAKKDPKREKEYQDLVSIVRDQLGNIACVIVDESGHAVLPRQLFFKFHKNNSQDNESSSNTVTDFKPFFYRVPRIYSKLGQFEELFKVAGARMVPDIDQLLDVLTQLADKKKNGALNPNQLDLSIRILRYCSQLRILQPENHERYFAASVPVILAPDTHSRLKPSAELIYDDSHWLHHRINMDEFSLAHKNISQFIASQMHIQPLSEIVEEIFNPNVKIQPVNLTEAARFTATISASQFCEGLLRISMHELSRRKSEKLDVAREVKKLEQKVMQLQQFKVVIVPTIHSQFIDTRNKRNVTKDATGTNCLLDEHTKTIYLIEKLPKAVKYEELLVIEINRYLGNSLRNLLPLQSILTCDPSDILSVLNHYKIDQKGVGNFTGSMTNKSYGTPLTSEQKQSLTFSPLLPLTVDETVAWKHKDDDKFYYGVIKSIDSEDREFLTDVTVEAGDVTLTISSIYVYKFVDEMHPEPQIHLVGKMLEKLLKEIEILDARKDKHVTDIQRELVLRVHERWAHSSEITSLVKKIEFALDM